MCKLKFLITGANGQIGKGLIPKLTEKYGLNTVIATDIGPKSCIPNCNYETLDVTNKENFEYLIKANNINCLIHLAVVMSALGEKNVFTTKQVNVDSVLSSFELSNKYNLKLFIPSSIAVYGGIYDKSNVSVSINPKPTTFYGVSKVLMENLGNYYKNRYGLDFRCLRYTGVISPYEFNYNSSSYYATEIFFKAVKEKKYTININKERRLPFCHLDDIVNGTIKFLEAPREKISKGIYNIEGLNFTPNEIVKEIKKIIPEFKESYDIKEQDRITSDWPQSLSYLEACSDWDWNPNYKNIDILVRDMINEVRNKV